MSRRYQLANILGSSRKVFPVIDHVLCKATCIAQVRHVGVVLARRGLQDLKNIFIKWCHAEGSGYVNIQLPRIMSAAVELLCMHDSHYTTNGWKKSQENIFCVKMYKKGEICQLANRFDVK